MDFDTTKNLFIEGDNLDALKLLQETYLGKVKLIYIDPPYNTGNDFIYKDKFAEDKQEYYVRSGQRGRTRKSDGCKHGSQWAIPFRLANDDLSPPEARSESSSSRRH